MLAAIPSRFSAESIVIESHRHRFVHRAGGTSLIAVVCLLGAAAVQAQAGAARDDTPANLEPLESVPPPPPLRSGEALEPQVTIGERRGTVQEYYVGGRLMAIKVIPRDGPPYYLVDADGDGHLETRRHELGSDILVNSWLLFTWP